MNPVFPINPAFPNAIKYHHEIIMECLWLMMKNIRDEEVLYSLIIKYMDNIMEHVLSEGLYMHGMGYPHIEHHIRDHRENIFKDYELLNSGDISGESILGIINRWSNHMYLQDGPMEEWVERSRKRF